MLELNASFLLDVLFPSSSVEFAVNDERNDQDYRSYDHLLRSLLTLPTAPAVMTMEFFVLGAYNLPTGAGGNQVRLSSPSFESGIALDL